MLDKKNLVYLVFSLLILFSIVLSIINFTKNSQNEILVADTQRLFNEFKMTKETKKTGDVIINKMKYRLDSLYFELKNAKTETSKSQIVRFIESERSNSESFNNNYSAQETAKIMERLKYYIKEYSISKNYHIILGFKNEGDILFFDNQKDVTEDLLKYANKKYEGFN